MFVKMFSEPGTVTGSASSTVRQHSEGGRREGGDLPVAKGALTFKATAWLVF